MNPNNIQMKDAVSSRKNSESSTKNEAHIAMEDFTHM